MRLHKLARTTPAIRAEIAASDESIQTLAQRYGVLPMTVFQWKRRSSFEDPPRMPHRLQTTLTPTQEIIAVELRKTLVLSLDDLLALTREFVNPDASRSGLDRCLRRHGVSKLRALEPEAVKIKFGTFAAYERGNVHIDVKYLLQMVDEHWRRYLFVAIDRATRWVFIQLQSTKIARAARAFLAALAKACPVRIRTMLKENEPQATFLRSNNAMGSTDRINTTGERTPTGQHAFDKLCTTLGIENRLTRPGRPQTHGIVERFNSRIKDVLRSHHFVSGHHLEQTLLRYAWLYNHYLLQAALDARTSIQAKKDRYQ